MYILKYRHNIYIHIHIHDESVLIFSSDKNKKSIYRVYLNYVIGGSGGMWAEAHKHTQTHQSRSLYIYQYIEVKKVCV